MFRQIVQREDVCRLKRGDWVGVFCLTAIYAYLIGMILDSHQSWMLPEAYYYKSHILKNIPYEIGSAFRESFNCQIFEFTDRITRPLSSLFEIFDTWFRGWLWGFVEPLPSISLTYLFTLVLVPILFYRLLRELEIVKPVAILAVGFLLTHMGTQSLVAMLFRPAKAMINFGLVLCLFAAMRAGRSSAHRRFWLSVIWGTLFFSFFFDETAVVIVGVLAILFPLIFFANRRRFAAFASLPCLLGICYLLVFPFFAQRFGFLRPDLLAYEAIAHPPIPKMSVVVTNILLNVGTVVRESFSLWGSWRYPKTEEVLVGTAYLLSLMVLIIFVVFRLKRNPPKLAVTFGARLCFAVLIFCVFHGLLLLLVGNPVEGRVWGPFWYGTYFSILFALLIAWLGNWAFCAREPWLYRSYYTAVILACAMNVLSFKYINFVYHRFHFYSWTPGIIDGVFRDREDRFKMYEPEIFQGRDVLVDLRSKILSGGPLPSSVLKEMYWLPLEMGALRQFPVPGLDAFMPESRDKHEYPIPLLSRAQAGP